MVLVNHDRPKHEHGQFFHVMDVDPSGNNLYQLYGTNIYGNCHICFDQIDVINGYVAGFILMVLTK